MKNDVNYTMTTITDTTYAIKVSENNHEKVHGVNTFPGSCQSNMLIRILEIKPHPLRPS